MALLLLISGGQSVSRQPAAGGWRPDVHCSFHRLSFSVVWRVYGRLVVCAVVGVGGGDVGRCPILSRSTADVEPALESKCGVSLVVVLVGRWCCSC